MPPAYPRRNKSLIRSICLQLTFLSLALLIAGCGDYISATADLTPSPNSTGGQPTPLATTPAMLTQPVPSAIQPGFTTSAHPGHLKPVTALVYTPDGKKLISASEDATIKIWEVSSGNLLNTLKGHTQEVEVLAISPNGQILASGGRDNMLKLWDLTTGKETATLRGYSELITSLAISPDGQTLASADYKGLTRLWELPDGKEKAVLKNSFGPLAFSPDGKLLATGGTTNQSEGHNLIRFIDLATNQEKFSLKTKGVSQLVFSPDGKMLVTASNFVSFTTASTLQLWELDSGKELASVEEKLAGTLAISPDGQTLAIGGNIFTGMSDRSLTDGVPLTISLVTDQVIDKGAIKLKELATLKDIASFPVQDALINTVVFSPDGKTLTSGSWNNSITFWQIPSGKQTGQIAGSPGVKALALTSDQKLLASGGDDGNIRLLNAVDGTEIRLLKGHSAKVSTVAFSPDGKILASGSKDDTARLWEVSSGKLLAILKGHDSWVNKLAFSPDGKLLATASSDTTLKLWEVASAKELKTLKGHPHAIWDVSFSPDGKTLVSAGNGKEAIFFWEVASGTAQPLKISTGEAVVTVAYSPDGKTLAGIGEGGAIKLWEVASGKEVSTLQGPLMSGSSYSRFIETGYLSFSPDGRTLLGLEATSYKGTILKLWEVALSRETFSASYNQSPVVEAAVMTPDGKRMTSRLLCSPIVIRTGYDQSETS